jgi:hypothetical protein
MLRSRNKFLSIAALRFQTHFCYDPAAIDSPIPKIIEQV